jgi:predicted nucleotidyltransferase
MILDEQEIDRIVGRIVLRTCVDRIYLFGSNAKGCARAGSDIDLLIIGPNRLPVHQRTRNIAPSLRSIASSFDLVILTPEEVDEELRVPHSFVSQVMATAQLVYPKVRTPLEAPRAPAG